jgi:hypothetical protein
LTLSFCLSIAQDPSESSKAPWLKVIWVSLKVRSVDFNPEENSCLSACVLLRNDNIDATPNPFAEFSFAKGLAKVNLGGAC